MKFITTLFTFAFLITSTANSFERDLELNARNQVEDYYAASGEWSLLKIKKIEKVQDNSVEFISLSAKVQIQNIETARIKSEVCLVTFVADNNDFFAINCF